jgi:3-deoxy-D-manno-octulosonic-acid transferase
MARKDRPSVPDPLPFGLRAYRLLTSAVSPLAPWLLAHRLKRGKEHPARQKERYGLSDVGRPPGPLIWVHCASIGELLAVIPLIGRIRERGLGVLCTSGTLTSAKLAEARLPLGAIHQFVTLDFRRFVNRFFQHWRPDLGLFVESDLWPNLILAGAQRGIPLILVNARLSERSFRRWQWGSQMAAALLRSFDVCLAQSPIDAQRYRDLGAPRVATTGNLKLDVPEPAADAQSLAALRASIGARSVFAGASTHPGEEAVLIEAHRRLRHSFAHLMTIIVPRHPERGRDILRMARAADLQARLRSLRELPQADTDIYVADTLGELGLIYRLAPIVFMGGSLASHGGQNPIEAAKLGAAILHGPHVWNFAEIYAALDAAHGAEQIADVGKLTVRIGAWLKDPQARTAAATAARNTVSSLGGALDRTLAAIEPYLMQIRIANRHNGA